MLHAKWKLTTYMYMKHKNLPNQRENWLLIVLSIVYLRSRVL